MTEFDDREWWLDEDLRSLQVLDVNATRSQQTLERCLSTLARRRVATARERRFGWAEPVVVAAGTILYLAAAVHASLALWRL